MRDWPRRVLVTGGAGFIGSHLCARLIEEGARVIAIDNLLTGRVSNIEPLLGLSIDVVTEAEWRVVKARLQSCSEWLAARPQPRLDRDNGKGMAITVGRIFPDTVFDYRFVTLSHNTVRGAAGAAILNAELLIYKGII